MHLSAASNATLALCMVGGLACGGSVDGSSPTVAPLTFVDSLVLSRDSASLSADGTSIVTITATTNASLHPRGSLIAFAASDGAFLPSGNLVTAVTDDSGQARVQLRASTDVVISRITSTIGNLIAFDGIQFTRSLPDTLSLGVDRLALTVSGSGITNTAKLTATLARKFGLLSTGQIVRFSAFRQGTSDSFPGISLSPTFAVASGSGSGAASPMTASVNLFADSTTPSGFLVVIAHVNGTGGRTLADTATIRVSGSASATTSTIAARSSGRGDVVP